MEQLWRDFNQRLNAFFGQKNRPDNGGNNNGGGGGPRPDMKGAGITAGVVGVIAVFIWLASGAFIVQEGQNGVVLTFGKYSHTTPAGFNWRWPYRSRPTKPSTCRRCARWSGLPPVAAQQAGQRIADADGR